MMKPPVLVILGLFLLPRLVFPEDRPEIVIAADQWCPINCLPDSDRPGFMIEIAGEIFNEAGYRVVYRLMPWSRAIVSGREGTINAIVGAYRGDAPGFVFPRNEQGRIGSAALFTRAGSDWVYQDLSSLEQVRLGTILDYDYGESLNGYIEAHSQSYRVQVMTGNDPLAKNIEKLLRGRIDVVVEAKPVFRYLSREMGVEGEVRHAGEAAPSEDAYIAFSPGLESSPEYARILSEGMERLRASGELARILARYNLDDWKTGE